MSGFSDLVVRLRTDTRQFRSGMRDSAQQVSKFDKVVERSGAGLAKFRGMLGALGAGVGAGAFVASIRSQMAQIDALAKTSDQLGIPIERLQELRHAAELTGAGAQTLADGIGTLQKRLGESARRGSGPAAEALGELGLSVNTLVGMDPAQQLSAIADAMQNIEQPARRNAIAANLFSKANMSLVNTLAQGSDGLAAMGAELERYGGTISRDMAAQVEEANDALTRMGAQADLAAKHLTVGLAPAFRFIGDSAKYATATFLAMQGGAIAALKLATMDLPWQEERRNFAQGIGLPDPHAALDEQPFMRGSEDARRAYIAELDREMQRISNQIAGLTAPTPPTPPGIGDGAVADNAERAADAVKEMRLEAEPTYERFERMRDLLTEWQEKLDGLGMSDLQRDLAAARKEMESIGAASELTAEQWRELEAKIRQYHQRRAQDEIAGLAEQYETPEERAARRLRELEDLKQRAGGMDPELARRIRADIDDELERSRGRTEAAGTRFAGANEVGSLEAYRQRLATLHGSMAKDPAKDTAKNTEKLVAQNQELIQATREQSVALRDANWSLN